MPTSPSSRLTIKDAIYRYIRPKPGISVVGGELVEYMLRALADGNLVAEGQYKDAKGNIVSNKQIPTEVWKQISAEWLQFYFNGILQEDLDNINGAYYRNPTLDTSDIDSWLSTVVPHSIHVQQNPLKSHEPSNLSEPQVPTLSIKLSPVSKKELKDYLEKLTKEKGGQAPAMGTFESSARTVFAGRPVGRETIRKIHEGKFGKLSPGPRKHAKS